MQFLLASEVSFDPRPQMGRIFAESYYQWLRHFSKNKDKLGRAFAHVFDLNQFFVAAQDDTIIGFAACTDGSKPIALHKKTLCKNLGFIVGRIAFMMLSKHLLNQTYPFEMTEDAGEIAFVATAENHRRKGIAENLIRHILDAGVYLEYILEVADNNEGAVRLYEKLGFTEFMRAKAPKQSGINFFIYMVYRIGDTKGDHYEST